MTAVPLGEEHRRRRGRNYALAAVLVFFVVLVFVITLVKLSGAA